MLVRWLGFKISEIEVEHGQRKDGKSAYNFRKLISLAVDIILSQSNKPLRLSIKFGFFLSSIAFLYGLYLITRYLMFSIRVEGWTSVMVSIYFFAGLLLANMGILGLYIGKIFDESKKRPLYVIKSQIGF